MVATKKNRSTHLQLQVILEIDILHELVHLSLFRSRVFPQSSHLHCSRHRGRGSGAELMLKELNMFVLRIAELSALRINYLYAADRFHSEADKWTNARVASKCGMVAEDLISRIVVMFPSEKSHTISDGLCIQADYPAAQNNSGVPRSVSCLYAAAILVAMETYQLH